MDINTDPNHSRITDPDTVLGSTWVPGVTMGLVAAQAIQISVALVATWPSDTNMVSGV